MNDFDYNLYVRKSAFDLIVADSLGLTPILYVPEGMDREKLVADVKAYLMRIHEEAEAAKAALEEDG